jgi:hypothetical protein
MRKPLLAPEFFLLLRDLCRRLYFVVRYMLAEDTSYTSLRCLWAELQDGRMWQCICSTLPSYFNIAAVAAAGCTLTLPC